MLINRSLVNNNYSIELFKVIFELQITVTIQFKNKFEWFLSNVFTIKSVNDKLLNKTIQISFL